LDRPSVRDIILAPAGGIRGSGTCIPESAVRKKYISIVL